jgi:hypothetical protein
MRCHPIDPRSIRWEDDRPAYQVHFWFLRDDEEGQPSPWSSDEWMIEDAEDVSQVLQWVQENAQDRRFVLYAHTTCADGPGLIRLQGKDPSRVGE